MARRSLLRRIGIGLLPLLILAAGFLGMGVLVATKPQLAPVPVAEKVWTVRTVPAAATAFQPEMLFYGEVKAGREVDLRPLVSGRIVEVSSKYRSGAYVEAGEILVAVDPFDYEAALAEAEAELKEARARAVELETDLETANAMLEREQSQRDLRQRDADRFANLRKRGAVSTKARDDAQLALLNAIEKVVQREFSIKKWQATYDRQQAVVSRLEVKVQRAKRDLDDTKAVAPFSGYLTDIGTDLGKQVTQADRIARIIDPSRMDVRFSIGSKQFGEMLADGGIIGRTVDVVWKVAGSSTRYSGTITRTGAEIDAASGGVEVYAELDLSSGTHLLRPGAFVEVRMKGPAFANVVRLPESAWHNGQVFAVEDGRLAAREASLVYRSGQDVLVRGAMSAQDRVLVTPIPAVEQGMRVELMDEAS